MAAGSNRTQYVVLGLAAAAAASLVLYYLYQQQQEKEEVSSSDESKKDPLKEKSSKTSADFLTPTASNTSKSKTPAPTEKSVDAEKILHERIAELDRKGKALFKSQQVRFVVSD